MLEIVGGALKDVSVHARKEHKQKIQYDQDQVKIREEHERRRELIIRGGWHDGRLDCVAGNGPISELGLGLEPTMDGDLIPLPPPLMDDNAPIDGEAVPPTAASLQAAAEVRDKVAEQKAAEAAASVDLDAESEFIQTMPIVVLKNYSSKAAKGDLWNVLSEWGASLIENRVAHVVIVAESTTAIKSLTKALPSKPLNSVTLADADATNSLAYVKDKLKDHPFTVDDGVQVAKLGGRMVDLETLVYKARTGSTLGEAVDDIISRNTVELRKQAFGDDGEDAKSLPWTRPQAWKVVAELAKKGEVRWIFTDRGPMLICRSCMLSSCRTSPSRDPSRALRRWRNTSS